MVRGSGPRPAQDFGDKLLKTYPDYPQNMLDAWCNAEGVKAALKNSIAVLSELYRGFNEVIYQNYIEPNKID